MSREEIQKKYHRILDGKWTSDDCDSIQEIIDKYFTHPADVGEALEALERLLMETDIDNDVTQEYNEIKQTLIAQSHELAEFKKEYIPVKVEHLYLVNKRRNLFAGNCPICKSWVSEEFADMGDKEMRYCYCCGNELEFKGVE